MALPRWSLIVSGASMGALFPANRHHLVTATPTFAAPLPSDSPTTHLDAILRSIAQTIGSGLPSTYVKVDMFCLWTFGSYRNLSVQQPALTIQLKDPGVGNFRLTIQSRHGTRNSSKSTAVLANYTN